MKRVVLLFETVRHLKLRQMIAGITVKFRNKKKGNYTAPPMRNASLSIAPLDTNETYLERFHPLSEEQVKLLNQSVPLDFSPQALGVLKPLIRFNLLYFEYAIAFAQAFKQTGDKRYVQIFLDTYRKFLSADVRYYSYVISLHIPNVLIALEQFGEAIDRESRNKIEAELYRQYRWLLKHQELRLLANHYFENLKAIVIASYYFSEIKVCKKYCKKLKGQVREQVLKDGVHFELSMMYHKIILEDLLRIEKLSQNSDFPSCPWLEPAIEQMLNAIVNLEKGFGRTPLFNDSGDNVAKTVGQLLSAGRMLMPFEPQETLSFEQSGYYKLYDGKISLLMDMGKLAPDYMVGHGHCDCLSFEVALDGLPLFVNEGTYHYQGEKRKMFRSTKAHNTFAHQGREQSQLWGEHRAGKRISKVCAKRIEDGLEGSVKTAYGAVLKRSVKLKEGTLSVYDSTNMSGMVESYLHLAPDFQIKEENGNLHVTKAGRLVAVIRPLNCEWMLTVGEYAPSFGELKGISCIVFRWYADEQEHGYHIDFAEIRREYDD